MLPSDEMLIELEERKLEDLYRRNLKGEVNFGEEGENIIPRHFALKSIDKQKYLRYIKEEELEGGSNLQFSGERMISPYTKFEVEYSSLEKEYIHIRSCYNNKYWVREASYSDAIVAAANEADEDVSKWSCTLFEVIYNKDKKAYKFRHVQLDSTVYLIESQAHPGIGTIPKNIYDGDNQAFSTVIDWDSIFILPKQVAFKGHNGDYLRFNRPYLQFSGSSSKDLSAAHEIFPTKDGYVQIKNLDSGEFWFYDTNWILATKSNPSPDNRDTLFWPLKVNDNTVAFRCLGNNKFCSSLTLDGKTNCLNANSSSVRDGTRMEVEEVAISRMIDNVEYRLKDARIYDQKVISMAKGDAINKTQETDTITFKFSYEDKKKRSWTSSVSAKLGFKVSVEADVPMLGKANISTTEEFGTKHDWGETIKEKKITEFSYVITVPSNTRVKINAVIKQGTCQVPFSYRRTDILKNGKRVVHHLHDGLFTGVNTFDNGFSSVPVPMEDL